MNAEQLRNSILQEAISGRLVPQDPNDEPASILLQRIREEKARLVKEGKLKKKDLVETPITDDEKPFEIPSSWAWCRFGNIVINRDSERIPLSVEQRSKLKKEYDYYGASGVIDKVESYLFDKDLLLIGEDGANLINRSTPIAFIAHGKYWVNNHAHVIDCINETFMRYICTYINAISLVKYVTGTAQPKMNQEKMNSILVSVPPLEEQKRIVVKLEELLPIVEQYGKAQEELDELNAALPARLRQSILQEAISGRLVPQDPNDEPASVLLERMQNDKRKVIPIQDEEMPYEIPGSWEWVNLGSIVSIITGKKDANFGSEDGTYDFFTCSNTPIKCKSYSYDGDYLIMPGNGANIGKVIHYKGKFEAYQRTYLLQGYGNFDLDYLKYHLMCNWKEYNQDKLYGSAIPYIKLGNLMSYPVALPPLAEQQRIVAKIEELFEQIDKINK